MICRMPPTKGNKRRTTRQAVRQRAPIEKNKSNENHGEEEVRTYSANETISSNNVSMEQFKTLQNTVNQMKDMMKELTTGLRNITTQTQQYQEVTTPMPTMTNPTNQAEELSTTIDKHINQIVNGNVNNNSISPQGHNNMTHDTYISPPIHSLHSEEQFISTGGQYINLTRQLDNKLTDKIKDKIWAREYVDLNTLVDNRNEDTQTFHLISGIGEPLKLAPNKPDNKIHSLSKWNDAFLVYLTVYAKKYPAEVPQIASYMQLIKRLAIKGGDFLYYDKEFRYLRQAGHSGWEVHLDLWLEARDIRGNNNTQSKPNKGNNYKGNNNSFRGQPRDASKPTHPAGYCYRYHSYGKCNNMPACSFKHTCYYPNCGGKHPISTCNKRTGDASSKSTTTPTTK